MEPQRAAEPSSSPAIGGPFELPFEPGFSQGSGSIPQVAPAPPDGGGGLSASELAFGERPTVRLGSRGPAVADLQARLDARGESLAIDGVFGPLTRAAVVRFQTARGLDPDGIVGPLTWGALDGKPATGDGDGGEGDLLEDKDGGDVDPTLEDLGGEGDNVAVGDAEENGNDPGGGRVLETLDRDGDDVAPGLLGDPGSVFGFKEKVPARPPPVAHVKKAELIAGGFADRGAYKSTGDGFDDAELDELLAAYGSFWGVDVRALATPDDTSATTPGAGDSAGKGVSAHPPWVKALTNKIMGRAKWDEDDRATQRLIEAFLRRFARDAGGGGLPPGAEQLFHMIGSGETNGEANALQGFKGGSNWCAPASHVGLILGMYNRGIRFKTDTHSTKYGAELQKQIGKYAEWTKQPGHVVSGAAAHTAQLAPGDIISVVNGGKSGPLSGHVATVVEHVGEKIVYVSGNAAGVVAFEGGVRIEEVQREQPPAGYSWSAIAARDKAFQGHKQTEKSNGESAQAKRARMSQHLDFILRNLDPLVAPPFVDLTNPASVAALIAFLGALPASSPERDALIGNAVEIARLQGEVIGHDTASSAARAAQNGMLNDGGLPVNRDDKRFVPGTHAPVNAASSWVVEVIRASALTKATVLAAGSLPVVEPNDPMLEKGPTLVEQCPDAPKEAVNRAAT
jgi:hypothetical protein